MNTEQAGSHGVFGDSTLDDLSILYGDLTANEDQTGDLDRRGYIPGSLTWASAGVHVGQCRVRLVEDYLHGESPDMTYRGKVPLFRR